MAVVALAGGFECVPLSAVWFGGDRLMFGYFEFIEYLTVIGVLALFIGLFGGFCLARGRGGKGFDPWLDDEEDT